MELELEPVPVLLHLALLLLREDLKCLRRMQTMILPTGIEDGAAHKTDPWMVTLTPIDNPCFQEVARMDRWVMEPGWDWGRWLVVLWQVETIWTKNGLPWQTTIIPQSTPGSIQRSTKPPLIRTVKASWKETTITTNSMHLTNYRRSYAKTLHDGVSVRAPRPHGSRWSLPTGSTLPSERALPPCTHHSFLGLEGFGVPPRRACILYLLIWSCHVRSFVPEPANQPKQLLFSPPVAGHNSWSQPCPM